jgi:cell division septation protein DedD
MHEVFDEDDFKPGLHRRDTELTLGPMLLLGFFSGLVLLCCLCFWLGYVMGSHATRSASATAQQSGAQAALPAAGAPAKPSAVQQAVSPRQNSASSQPAADATEADAGIQDAGVTPASASASAVRPALAAAATAPTPSQSASASALVVQIAVVPHQEDADVLVSALRRRGYAAGVRRDAADGQFHVRIGPFSNRNDAYSTRQKLLNDGYNAVVQQ